MDNLQRKLETALLDDPRTREAAIEVVNKNGIITLAGIVSAHQTSEAAEAIVKDIGGVTTVVNEIQVKAEDKSDFDVYGSAHEDVSIE